jgi:type VI secretion system protein ImpE
MQTSNSPSGRHPPAHLKEIAMPKVDAGALFHEGRLSEAVEAAGAAIRAAPTEPGPRMLLAELLLYAGDPQRADAVLQATSAVDPGTALVVAEFRQLLRAASIRHQVLFDGRAPEFLGEPTLSQTHLLQALLALREGDRDTAIAAAAAAEAVRPAVSGRTPDARFTDCRDADDLWAGTFEVLTTTGKYFWIPAERVASLEFHPPKRPRDLFWRRCSMVVRDGPDGDVYVPALYAGDAEDSDSLRLGRSTEWTDSPPVRGRGRRMFLIGDEGVEMQQLTTLEFE